MWPSLFLQMMVSFLFWLSVKRQVSHLFDVVAVLGDPEDRMHCGEDILQDCSSERCSLTKTESDPACDLSLPGEKYSVAHKTDTFCRRSSNLKRKKKKNLNWKRLEI